MSKSPAAHPPPADSQQSSVSLCQAGSLPRAQHLLSPGLAAGPGVLRDSTAARLGSRRCENTSPLLQSRVRQGSESHLPGQSSSARGSRAVPGGKEVLSRRDTCSRMETEHLKQITHIFYKPKKPASSACARPCICVPERECATEGKTALVILGEGRNSPLTHQV